MLFNEMYNIFLAKLFSFKGRSNRKEYISRILLIIILIAIRIYYIDRNRDQEVTPFFAILNLSTALFLLIYILQYFPLSVRRLHDLNESGWYVLLTFVPFCQFFILWLMFRKGTQGTNKYGEPPII